MIKRGFTLVEILIAVGIIGLVSTLVIIPLASFRDSALLDGAAEEILALLHEARARTVSSDGASRYGVYLESDKITLFKGASFPGAGDPNNKEVSLHNRLILTMSNSLVNGLVFERLTGEVASGGTTTISLVSDNTKSRTIEISSIGAAGLK